MTSLLHRSPVEEAVGASDPEPRSAPRHPRDRPLLEPGHPVRTTTSTREVRLSRNDCGVARPFTVNNRTVLPERGVIRFVSFRKHTSMGALCETRDKSLRHTQTNPTETETRSSFVPLPPVFPYPLPSLPLTLHVP